MPDLPTYESLVGDACSGQTGNLPFGEQTNRELDAIRAELIEAGHPDGPELFFETRRVWTDRAKGKLTYAQRQDLARWLGLRWVAPRPSEPRIVNLTREEAEYLLDRLAGANDAVAQGILKKCSRGGL